MARGQSVSEINETILKTISAKSKPKTISRSTVSRVLTSAVNKSLIKSKSNKVSTKKISSKSTKANKVSGTGGVKKGTEKRKDVTAPKKKSVQKFTVHVRVGAKKTDAKKKDATKKKSTKGMKKSDESKKKSVRVNVIDLTKEKKTVVKVKAKRKRR